MPVIRTVLLILALLLGWIALQAETSAHPATTYVMPGLVPGTHAVPPASITG